MSEKRKDKKGRILRNGEYQRKDGLYQFEYVDITGKSRCVYSWKLEPTDVLPKGKRKCISLREKERDISKSIYDDVVPYGDNLTVCQLAQKYVLQKQGVRESTRTGGEYGEGIVVKSMTRLNDPNSRQPFYLKIVGEKFTETKGQRHNKVIDPDKLKSMEENKALAETIVTPARVEKILNKFVDENILPEDWGNTEMSIIAKNLPKAVYEDCVKEEPETVIQIENFGKVANSITMQIARNIMNNR